MDPETAQIVVGGLGIAGTLAASVFTQSLSRRAERERRQTEDETRWLPDRLALATEFLSKAGRAHRKLYGVTAFLNAPEGTYEDRHLWLGGHMNVMATPEEGLPGVFSATDREILLEDQIEVQDLLEDMEDIVSRVVLLGSQDEGEAAERVHEALWDAEGHVEMYAPGNLVYPAIFKAQEAIKEFSAAARIGLRVNTESRDGSTPPSLPGS